MSLFQPHLPSLRPMRHTLAHPASDPYGTKPHIFIDTNYSFLPWQLFSGLRPVVNRESPHACRITISPWKECNPRLPSEWLNIRARSSNKLQEALRRIITRPKGAWNPLLTETPSCNVLSPICNTYSTYQFKARDIEHYIYSQTRGSFKRPNRLILSCCVRDDDDVVVTTSRIS
jgi:hypothetical protein